MGVGKIFRITKYKYLRAQYLSVVGQFTVGNSLIDIEVMLDCKYLMMSN